MPRLAELPISFSATGDNIIIPAVPDVETRVYSWFFTISANTLLTVKDGPAIVLTGPMAFLAFGDWVLDWREESPSVPLAWFTTSPGNALIINQSGVAQVSGRIYYLQAGPGS